MADDSFTVEAITCRRHPQVAAAWRCTACDRLWCDRCVIHQRVHDAKNFTPRCPKCGGATASTTEPPQPDEPAERNDSIDQALPGWVARLPEPLRYPLRGSGVTMILTAAVLFGVVLFLSTFLPFIGLLGLLIVFYLNAWYLQITLDTACGQRHLPDWPSIGEWWEDIIKPNFALMGCGILCLGPSVIYGATREDPGVIEWIVQGLLLVAGAAYLPMAILGMCMYDSIGGISPHIVLPAIARTLRPYAVTVLGVVGIYGLEWSVQTILGMPESLHPLAILVVQLLSMIVTLYCSAVTFHLIGRIYLNHKYDLAWFETEP